jgi:hypothetical protein
MRRASRVVLLALLVILAGWAPVDTPAAQDDARKALIGAWEGIVTQGSNSGPVRLEFSEQGQTLGWTWTWEASVGKGEAQGEVAKFTPPSMELSGRYTSHPIDAVRNSPITMSLTLSGNQLRGTGLTTAVNREFSVSLTKKAVQ